MSQKLVQYSYKLKKEKQQKISFFVINLFIVIILLNLITYFVFPVRQTSLSMEPDFVNNSFNMATPLLTNYKRGDVILIRPKQNDEYSLFKKIGNTFVSFFTARQLSLIEKDEFPGTKEQIRRIVGLPGDTIYMKDYIIYIKPASERHFLSEFELIDKTYNVTFYTPPAGWDSTVGVKGIFEEIVLGTDEYFVLSDNRKASSDSRLWGPVKKEQIHAKIFACYFPFNKAKLY